MEMSMLPIVLLGCGLVILMVRKDASPFTLFLLLGILFTLLYFTSSMIKYYCLNSVNPPINIKNALKSEDVNVESQLSFTEARNLHYENELKVQT